MTRVSVTIPDDLLREIDDVVGPSKRAEFLQQAARRELNRRKRDQAFERAAGSISAEDHPEWETSEQVATWVRNLRHGSLPRKEK